MFLDLSFLIVPVAVVIGAILILANGFGGDRRLSLTQQPLPQVVPVRRRPHAGQHLHPRV
jgi:hypothetical protein